MKSAIFILLCASSAAICSEIPPPTDTSSAQPGVFTLWPQGTSQTNPITTTLDPFNPYPNTPVAPADDQQSGAAAVITIPLQASNETPTDLGFFSGGTLLQLLVSGVVSLGPTGTTTNPDGSLALPISDAICDSCWAPGYQYFIPDASYPQDAGGDGVNHLPGGGGNYDLFFGNHSPWAAEGATTTDTTDPLVIRFGEVAGTFSSQPVPNSLDWFTIGTGGTFLVPDGGAHLYVIIADTYYANNSGEYTVQVDPVPEPHSLALLAFGLALFGSIWLAKFRSRPKADGAGRKRATPAC